MLRSNAILALSCILSCTAALGCGRSSLDVFAANGGDGSGSTTEPVIDDPGVRPDLPPPSLGCEAQGGQFVQVEGPWVLASSLYDWPPAYGLVADDDGLLAMWRGPFLGTNPMPNLLGVRVGYDGVLQTMVAPVWARPVTQEPAVHRAEDGALVTFCGRFGAEDRPTSQIIDALGNPLGEEVVRDAEASCGAARPEGVFTGSHYLFAWTDNSTFETTLQIADRDTQTIASSVLGTDGNLSTPPRIAVGPQGAGLIAGLDSSSITWMRLDFDGTPLSPTVTVHPPPGFTVGQAAIGAASDGTFTVFVANRFDPGMARYRVGVDEEGMTDSFYDVPELTDFYSEPLLVHRAGGYLLVADATDDVTTRVAYVATDERGEVQSHGYLQSDGTTAYEARAAVTMHEQDAWVLYTAGYDDGRYDVRLAHLACVR